MKIDRAPGRREFCDSDRESDLSDELEIVTKRHNRKLKFHKLKTQTMTINQLEKERGKTKISGLNFEDVLRI